MDIHDDRSRDPANPAVQSASDFGARAWGLVLLAVGLWLFARITLGLDLPDVAWADLWPAGLVVIGLIMLLRSGRRP